MPYTSAQIRALFAKYSKKKAREIVHEGGHHSAKDKTKKVKRGKRS